MPKPVVLVVDDEPDLCELLSITLQRMDLSPRTADSVAAAELGNRERSGDKRRA